jgi:hypothetical protein
MFSGSGGGGGLGQFFSGLFGNSGAPYQAGMNQLQQYLQQMQNMQNPWIQNGQQAMGNYNNMLGNMSNPSQFINNLMQNYQQSPNATFQMAQGQRAANNAASASGQLGSTPFAQQSQQMAQGISSQDMNQWLQNALGVNNQALQGYGNEMQMGQNATNNLMNEVGQYGQSMAQGAYGQQAGQNQDQNNIIGGLLSMFQGALGGGINGWNSNAPSSVPQYMQYGS